MRKVVPFLLCLIIISSFLLSGCDPGVRYVYVTQTIEGSNQTITITETVTVTTNAVQNTSTSSNDWISAVQSARVVVHSYNWDADSEDDGVRVWVELNDANEDFVPYINQNMSVQISVYSTESKTYPWSPSRLLYSSSATLTSYTKDAYVTGALGIIDINWDDMLDPIDSEQQKYGLIYVYITLPNNTVYSAQNEVQIVSGV